MAHRPAVVSKAIPAEAIAILPPPPPKAPAREPVVPHEAQPVSGIVQNSGPSEPVVLSKAPQAKGESSPQERGKQRPQSTEETPTTSGETSPQDMGKQRPKSPDSEGKGTGKTRTKPQISFSSKTNVRWRLTPLTLPQSLLRELK